MAAESPVPFGTLLRRYRRAAGLTQEEVAERAGVSVRAIGDLERGVSRAPHKDTVALLADALGLQTTDRATFASAVGRLGVPLSALSHGTAVPPFVGRQRELAVLERHLARQGPPLLVLAGEPGIGKTRLLHAAIPRAVAQGWRVLEGGSQRQGGQEPYAPLLEALQRHLRHQRPAQLRLELQGCAWLVRLLPELAEGPIPPLPSWTVPPEQERRLMVEAVRRFLSNIAGPTGTLLLLDDLQWAGQDALDLIALLVRMASEGPLRVVGAYRDTEMQPQEPLGLLLADLAAGGLAAQRRLGPLAPSEAAHLLDGLLGKHGGRASASRERVLQRTGGVPFFVVSYAQAQVAGQDEDGRAEDLPWDVEQSVRQRVAALPGRAQEVLGVAAVLGREAEPAILTAVVEHGEHHVLEALDATRHARLLMEGQDRYRFAHDVIREVVEADLGMARRTVLHRRIAEALEQRGARPVELLAYHYGRGGVQSKAVLYLEQAGDRAQAQYAHAASESFYATAVEGWERLGQPLEAARVLAKAAAALRLLGRYDAAQLALERAAETYRAGGDREHLLPIVAEIGRLYFYCGRPGEGLRWLEPQVTTLEAATPAALPRHALAPLYQALGALYGAVGRYGEALAVTARSVDLVREVDAGTALATALYRYAGRLMFIVGRIADMHAIAMEAAQVAEAAGDLNALHWALYILAEAHRIKGEWVPSWAYADRAVAVAERRGDPGPLVDLVRARGMVAFYRGDWGQARQDFERTQTISRQIGASYPYGDIPALLPRARLALAEGQWEVATRLSAEVLALAQQSEDVSEQRDAQALLAELDLRAGRAQAAYARLAPVHDQPGVEERGVTPLRVLLAWVHLELGAHEAAQEVIAVALQRLRADDDRLGLVDALRVQALVQTGCGCWVEAVASLEEGLALAGAMPYPYGEARLLHMYGAMLARRGERGPARERLEAALATVRRLGARGEFERITQDLASLQS